MKKLFLVLVAIIPIYAFSQSEINFEDKLYEVYEPGSSNRTLMNINGDKLLTYPKGHCKIGGNYAIVNLFGESFLYDTNGEIFSYDEIIFLKNNRYVVCSDDHYGIVDKSGNIIIPIIYDYIYPDLIDDENIVVVKQNNKEGLLNIDTNEVVIPIDYDNIGDFRWYIKTGYNSFRLLKDGKYGLVDIKNKIIIPFKYDRLWADCENEISIWNNTIEDWEFTGLAKIEINKKKGIINIKNGKEIIPCIYDELQVLRHRINRIKAKKNVNWGVIDYKGNVVIPFEYEYISVFNYDNEQSDIYARKQVVGRENNITIFDFQGNKRLSGLEDVICHWNNSSLQNFYVAKRNGEWVILDNETLKTIVTFDEEFSITGDFQGYSSDISHHFFMPRDKNNLRAIFDIKKRKWVTEFSYTDIDISDCGTYAYCRTPNDSNNCIINLEEGTKKNLPKGCGVFGYNYSGRDIFEVYQKDDGTTAYGVINIKGDIVLPAKYNSGNGSSTIFFRDGFIIVYNVGIFDENGVLLLSGYYSDIYKRNIEVGITGDLMVVKKYDSNRKDYCYGYYVYDGSKLTELLPCIYSEGESYYQLCSHLYKNSKSEVDKNIPRGDSSKNSFAVIIANENYGESNVSDVRYAINDGKIFKEYCNKTLGIPEQNIKYKENATLNNIRSQINWVKDITRAHNGNAKVIFYYAGHGIPDETNNSSYLLPIDGIGNDPRSAYSLNELYAQLGELSAKQITVFMDACFSGAKRDGGMLTSARSIAIKAKSGTPKGNMIVFSAAQGDETAHQYNKKKHGMFTYFLLKKLQETKGEASLEELATYIKEQVEKCSIIENGKLQTPTIQLSPEFKNSIKDITL